MATVQTFGVTRGTLSRYSAHISITATSSPTDEEAEQYIYDSAARLCAALESIGASPATIAATPTGTGYALCAAWVGKAAASAFVRSRETTDPDTAKGMRDECDALLEELLQYPAALGDGQPTSTGSPNLIDSHRTRTTQIETAMESGSLLTRLAYAGRM